MPPMKSYIAYKMPISPHEKDKMLPECPLASSSPLQAEMTIPSLSWAGLTWAYSEIRVSLGRELKKTLKSCGNMEL